MEIPQEKVAILIGSKGVIITEMQVLQTNKQNIYKIMILNHGMNTPTRVHFLS